MTEDFADAQERDLARTRTRLLLWFLPVVLAAAGFLNPRHRWLLWAIAFPWAGLACIANAWRCGRVHCTFTGPLYIALSLACAANARGWSSVGWRWIWGAAAMGTLFAFMPEWKGRRYWQCIDGRCGAPARQAAVRRRRP